MKQNLLIVGDAQANAIASLLRSVDRVSARFEIRVAAAGSVEAENACDRLCLQICDNAGIPGGGAHAQRVIRFPHLRFNVLWPLASVNGFDNPEPPRFPHGRFPFGDGYVVNCVGANTPPREILAFTRARSWPATWPDLNHLFQAEIERLAALDAACDVKASFYILKRFAREPLFHAPNAPSNTLLREVAGRIVSLLFSDETEKVTLPLGNAPEMLASIQVPVHPLVAAHFQLDWYDPQATYRHRGEHLTYDQYFTQMIAHSYAVKYGLSEDNAKSRTVIVYGNCQAEAVASVLSAGNLGGVRVLYLRSFEEPGAPPARLEPRDVIQCALLWEQHDETNPFPYRDWLPSHCTTVKFPATDFNALWPLTCVNPYLRPAPPKYPFGRFPYGNRVIADCVARGMDADASLAYYHEHASDALPDLDRLLAIESARLKARDAKCDVTMSEYILSHFRDERLFWTVNHPTSLLLQTLVQALVARSALAHPLLQELNVEAILERFGPAGPLGITSVPIHPRVAEQYGLRWYDLDREIFQNWGDLYSYDAYLRTMIADSIDASAARGDVAQYAHD